MTESERQLADLRTALGEIRSANRRLRRELAEEILKVQNLKQFIGRMAEEIKTRAVDGMAEMIVRRGPGRGPSN